MSARVELVVEEGPVRGQRFRFEAHDVALFGRAEDCHIRLPEQDPTTSRHHFILEVNPPQARLRDLGSLAGTYVNGTRYGGRAPGETPEEAAQRRQPEVDLADGDQIHVGQHVLRVTVYREPPAPPAPAPPGRPADAGVAGAPAPASRQLPVSGGAGGGGAPAAAGAGQAVETPRVVPAPPAPAARPAAEPAAAPAAAPAAVSDRTLPGTVVTDPEGGSRFSHLFQQIARLAQRGPGGEVSAEGKRILAVLGDYEIEREIGRGSMGAVYLARHRVDGERVALKVMVAQAAVDERARRRFMREVEATRSLRHPNIVALRDAGVAGTTFFFTMELCAGGSLSAYHIRRGIPLTAAEAFPVFVQVLDGMAAAHAAGVIHRDIKPDNLLLVHAGALHDAARASPGAPLVKVADFGLAKSFADAGLSGLTVTGTHGGTLTYMPREQLVHFRDARPASDVWALGATFYTLLAGRPPRQPPPGRTLDPIALVLQGEVAPVRHAAPAVPERLAAVIDRALLPAPDARYPSAAEMRAALAAARP